MISEGLLTAPPIARPRLVGNSSTIREFGKSFRYFAEVNFEMDLLSPKIDALLFALASPACSALVQAHSQMRHLVHECQRGCVHALNDFL
ncbi:hypothetical protein BGX16_0674 [Hallerella succinigenes]|uniref:Uncharacterized protein n=1 Tax=Hallerella succinigenes TaxID=1896222 RepID=A0A2M9A525_9BACT|nr:hypothetical protein BGX16_0674 [Hallerella succinigenes]